MTLCSSDNHGCVVVINMESSLSLLEFGNILLLCTFNFKDFTYIFLPFLFLLFFGFVCLFLFVFVGFFLDLKL